ncbi:MAG: hypothetical protein K6C36_05325, partial [Clostridia bacterium]|nr:hypothetical protein [Clostridia bacterium]
MRILIVTEYFYPDSFRINDLVKSFVSDGYEVTVLTGQPDYKTGFTPPEYRYPKNRRGVYGGVRVIRVPSVQRKTGTLRRAASYGSFVLTAGAWAACRSKRTGRAPITSDARRRGTGYDLVFCYQLSPVFQLVPAMLAAARSGCPLLCYCCDLWPESLKAWNVPETGAVYRAV